MIRRISATVTCCACPLQIEGWVDVENGYDPLERTVLRRVFFYYRERHGRWGVGLSDLSVDGAVALVLYTDEEDQLDVSLGMMRVMEAVDGASMTIDCDDPLLIGEIEP